MEDANNRKIMTQPEKVDYILTKSAEYFGVDKKSFGLKNRTESRIWNKKRWVIYILYEYTTCNYVEISKLMGFVDASNVGYYIKTAKEELNDASYGNPKGKLIYKELLSYLNL